MKTFISLSLFAVLLAFAVASSACNSGPTPTETPVIPPTQVPTEVPTAAPTDPSPPTGPPADALLGDTWTRPIDEMVMVYVPAGTFQMGSDEGDLGASSPEFPRHAVTLNGFWMDQTEVANAQYDRCVEDGSCRPSGFAEDEERTGDDYPVETVSWHDAATYCEWVGGRLPTEAEWEYSARGPDGRTYPWGDQAPTTELCSFANNVIGTTAVGSYPAGASWCGALDLAGNVAEWVADWYDEDYYGSSPAENPTGPAEGDFKVLRGGSWGSDQVGVRAADRSYHVPPDHIYGGVGFRCVSD
jgi:serine/threonine-protein kinase